MKYVRVAEAAGRQFNRISTEQLRDIGLSKSAIGRWVRSGYLVREHEGVFALAPLLDDDWGRWMGATLTAPESYLSHWSAAAAYAFMDWHREFETITRPGSGGPRRYGDVVVYMSETLAGDCSEFQGIPITSVPRTLLDLARRTTTRALARAVREAIRLELTSLSELADYLERRRGRRGAKTLSRTVARYSGLPLERARSGAEVRALEILRDDERPMPKLNMRIAGEEADLSWAQERLIIEIDGEPFHLDVGEDARKEDIWDAAGWAVRRISSDDVYEYPDRLLALAPERT